MRVRQDLDEGGSDYSKYQAFASGCNNSEATIVNFWFVAQSRTLDKDSN